MPWYVGLDTMVAVEGDEDMSEDDVIAAAHEQITFLLSAADLKPQFHLDWNIEYEDDGTGRTEPLKREPSSSVGPEWAICLDCEHKWSDHDDKGCLWHTCDCDNGGDPK